MQSNNPSKSTNRMMGFLTPELMKEAIKAIAKIIGKTPKML